MTGQIALTAAQLEAFDHFDFVGDQVRDYRALIGQAQAVDIGGGAGSFAAMTGARVIDLDAAAVAKCRVKGVQAEVGDALNPVLMADDQVACLNLVLHHLVGRTEVETRAMQVRALAACRGRTVFVNEYVYESYVADLSAWLIYIITSSAVLSRLASIVSRSIPSLRANTFGVGVRFRSDHGWRSLFRNAGLRVTGRIEGVPEPVSAARRLLLIKTIRRNSYRLEPCHA